MNWENNYSFFLIISTGIGIGHFRVEGSHLTKILRNYTGKVSLPPLLAVRRKKGDPTAA